jgi:hypothetical protein
VAKWAAAMAVRHSSRTYAPVPVAPALLDSAQSFCDGLPAANVARVVLVREAVDAVFTGFVGSYGRVIGAPAALVIVGAEADPTVQECAGYMGEAAILEATSLGLETCWVAGFFDRTAASSLVPLATGERVLAVSPVGHARARPRLGEKILKRMAKAHKRRPLEEIAPGFDPETWPLWATNGLRLAQTAPSAANRQPWRFELELGASAAPSSAQEGGPAAAMIISSVEDGYDGKISRRLDCGIAMLHFEIGARLMGASGCWETLRSPRVARYYVTAVHDT